MSDPIVGDCSSYSPLRPMMMAAHCDFCGASEYQAVLIAAPGGITPRMARAHICAECVEDCRSAIGETELSLAVARLGE
jgi:hypothetical protein